LGIPEERPRVVIEAVDPEIDCGRFPIKRTVGESVEVSADAFTDGHDLVRCVLRWRRVGSADWIDSPMRPLGNDRFTGRFEVGSLGRYQYTVRAWLDRFGSWSRDLKKRVEAGRDVRVDLEIGSALLEKLASRAAGPDRKSLEQYASLLRSGSPEAVAAAASQALEMLAGRYAGEEDGASYSRELEVIVDPERARFSSWYEMFPRSASPEPDRPGTLRDCIDLLPYVASMGFDVLYLPPIHPIGATKRKGKNNRVQSEPSDPGSPWAIGGRAGGHTSVDPALGTVADLRDLAAAARARGIEVALDIAFQATPDHPYVREHPEWFRKRPDGKIQYAENPPKKYEDIYPFDFDTEDRSGLWTELCGVVRFWIDQGIRIFRVDNPHTKPFAFWEWLIGEIKRDFPEVVFLAEAFTRPKVMYRLAKLGFTQSYTYFAWRNTARELAEYFTELTQTSVREFFRPNLWPNTPDILTEYLQVGGRPAFMARAVLASTLGASWGIYGPAFELCENRALERGSEEYLDSEKYQHRSWDRQRNDNLQELIGRLNRIRRENRALQSDRSLRFHSVTNSEMLCFSKQTDDRSNVVVVAVNLDPQHTQSGWVDLDLEAIGIAAAEPFQVHDLLTDARYLWHGSRNYVELDPRAVPAHVLRVRRRVRTERDFDYFM
jgi:starch synthase (maltosyl-transferring)